MRELVGLAIADYTMSYNIIYIYIYIYIIVLIAKFMVSGASVIIAKPSGR